MTSAYCLGCIHHRGCKLAEPPPGCACEHRVSVPVLPPCTEPLPITFADVARTAEMVRRQELENDG